MKKLKFKTTLIISLSIIFLLCLAPIYIIYINFYAERDDPHGLWAKVKPKDNYVYIMIYFFGNDTNPLLIRSSDAIGNLTIQIASTNGTILYTNESIFIYCLSSYQIKIYWDELDTEPPQNTSYPLVLKLWFQYEWNHVPKMQYEEISFIRP